jgi:hypothetical protein
MAGKFNYLETLLLNLTFRTQTAVKPAAVYVALLTSNKGPRQGSTLYVVNTDFISLTANDGIVHYYKCTTGGTTASSQGALYPGAVAEAITDGAAVFTEQSAAVAAGTYAEAAYTGYARVGVTQLDANWNAPSLVSNKEQVSNVGAVTFGAPTSGPTYVWGLAAFDASTAGNGLYWSPLATVKTLNNGDAAPSFAAAALTVAES